VKGGAREGEGVAKGEKGLVNGAKLRMGRTWWNRGAIKGGGVEKGVRYKREELKEENLGKGGAKLG
jgi:hypothetical protein